MLSGHSNGWREWTRHLTAADMMDQTRRCSVELNHLSSILKFAVGNLRVLALNNIIAGKQWHE